MEKPNKKRREIVEYRRCSNYGEGTSRQYSSGPPKEHKDSGIKLYIPESVAKEGLSIEIKSLNCEPSRASHPEQDNPKERYKPPPEIFDLIKKRIKDYRT